VSVHENDQTVSHITVLADPTLASVTAAESAVAAFKLALRELGEPVPANAVRAVLTTSGLRLEVTAAAVATREHYGTPAPVEEIAEFIGDAPQAETLFDEPATFEVGDKVRITGNGPGGDPEVIQHFLPVGAVGVVVSVVVAELARVALVRVGEKENYVSLRHLEHA
jgi:hypothetical protein